MDGDDPGVLLPSSEDDGGPVDGRAARAVRTRAAIVDACIELIEEDDLRPTAPRIADRAGVSVRSVFQHFEDLEHLYGAVAERVVERVARLIVPVDPGAGLDDRVGQLVAQRATLLEALTPVRRAANAHAPFSAEIQRRLQLGHDFLRAQVADVFGPELAHLADDDRERAVDRLSVCLSWSVWENLRWLNHRSFEWSQEVVASLLRDVLAAVPA